MAFIYDNYSNLEVRQNVRSASCLFPYYRSIFFPSMKILPMVRGNKCNGGSDHYCRHWDIAEDAAELCGGHHETTCAVLAGLKTSWSAEVCSHHLRQCWQGNCVAVSK